MNKHIDVVIELIPEEGTITAKEISKLTGYNESFVRKIINIARSNGTPVCSTRHGYYISYENADIERTIVFLTHRINTQLRAINGLKNITNKEN